MFFILRIVFVVFCLLNSFVWAADVVEAQRLVSEGSYEQALDTLEALEKSTSEEFDLAKIKFLQAQVHVSSGATEQAIDIYQSLAKKFPSRPEPYLNLSAVYADQGDLELAREWAIKGLRSDDSYKKLYDNLLVIHGVLAANAYRLALSDSSTVSVPALATSEGLGLPGQPLVELAVEVRVESEVGVDEQADTVANIEAVVNTETRATAESLAETEEVSLEASEGELPEGTEYQEIETLVLSWANAWAAQNVEEYVSKYTDTYTTADISHAEWVEQRRVRLTNKGFIKVTLEQVEVANSDGAWQAEFWQTYESNSIKDTIKKRLSVERVNNKWLISAEEVM